MYWKSGKIAEENIKATEKYKFQYCILNSDGHEWNSHLEIFNRPQAIEL